MEYENRTHCPNCKRSYTISEARLATPNLSVKCPACQTRFLAAENVTYAQQSDVAQTSMAQTASDSTAPQTRNTSVSEADFDAQHDTTSVLDEDIDALLADLGATPTNDTPLDSSALDGLDIPLDVPLASIPDQAHEDDEVWLSALLESSASNVDQTKTVPAPNPTPTITDSDALDIPSPRSKVARQDILGQVLWGMGSLLLLTLLIVQYASFNVDNLVKNPNHYAKLSAACKILSCTLPSADVSAFTVQALPTASTYIEGQTDIKGYISNHASEQLYPNLHITLHGKDGVIGEALVAPKDYLVANIRLIASGAHVPFLLTLDAPNSEVERVDVRAVY